ncbi:MAG: hypothetical protein IRY85_14920 [Micromonosporaceae bacterium]|nr:hypothetical protein [Micromonosporaceae bacterium]
MTDRERLLHLAKMEALARRRAQRAATDLAEAVDDALRAGATLEEIGLWTGWNVADLDRLLDAEASRVYNRRYNRDRYRRVKAGEIEPYHGSSEGLACGCGCDRCEALRQRMREQEEARKRAGLRPGDPRHGTPSGRYRYGCKCALCLAAAP